MASKRKEQARQFEYNKQLQQMSQEFNAAEAEKSRAWSTAEREASNLWSLEQWNRENAYNSPSAKRARMEEAGFNPYLGLDDSGEAASITSSSTPSSSPASSTPNQVSLPGYRDDFMDIVSIMNSYYENQKTISETTGKDISNLYDLQFGSDMRKAQIASELNGNFEYLNDAYRNTRISEAPNMVVGDLGQRRAQWTAANIDNELHYAQAINTWLDSSAKKTLNKYLNAQEQASLFVKLSQGYNTLADTNLKKTDRDKRLKEIVLDSLDISSKRMDNRIKQETSDALVRSLNEENRYNALYYQGQKSFARALGTSDIKTALEQNTYDFYNAKGEAEKWRLFMSLPEKVRWNLIAADKFGDWTSKLPFRFNYSKYSGKTFNRSKSSVLHGKALAPYR